MWPKKWSPKFSWPLLLIPAILVYQNCGSGVDKLNVNRDTSTEFVHPEVDASGDQKVAEKVQVGSLVADRVLTTNIFISIFGDGVRSTAAVNIARMSTDFGSSFSAYDRVVVSNCNTVRSALTPLCATADATEVKTGSNVSLNVRREAWRMKTCHIAVESDPLLLHAMKRVDSKISNVNSLPVPDEQKIRRAFQLFFRSKPDPAADVVDALYLVGSQESENKEKWRQILLTLCLSPHWQVL